MSKYLVRVELHGASYTHYDVLHKSMAAQGFTRKIRDGNGVEYSLPTAEYITSTTLDGDIVRQQADSAAATTGLGRGVLVVEWDRAWWNGLQ